MYSSHHAALSLVAGVALAPFVSTPLQPVGTVAYAVVLGVGVDLDHFLVARYRTGNWRALRACLTDPRRVFLAQDEIFDPGEVWPLERLLSHALVGTALVGGLFAAGLTGPAVVSAVVLHVHVVADLLWDVARQESYHEQVREAT
ncbi:hypothetical protein [Halorubellus salinus]|uniref:hypothetical protein n=1 Tax=Halorubellus salinus TaxID=755309 RepID=UPI001D06102F|nr:hypothetical protein [Halorubellus salinus]